METLLIVFYCLAVLLFISTLVNKSYIFSIYLGSILICDILIQAKQHFLVYPKPYTGIGFVFFTITTALYLLIPSITLMASVYSFTKRIKTIIGPVLAWLSVSIYALVSYPAISGQSMLDLFYAYFLAINGAGFLYLLSKAKNKFTFSQSGLLLAHLASIVTTIIAIKNVNISSVGLENWNLISLCNCIFYTALIFLSWLNRFVGRLKP